MTAKKSEMLTIKLTKQEFSLITEWCMYHFWDKTNGFQDDINVDELMGWATSCLLMARLKTIADENNIFFGLEKDEIYKEDDTDRQKVNSVTQAFVDQYAENVEMIAKKRGA